MGLHTEGSSVSSSPTLATTNGAEIWKNASKTLRTAVEWHVKKSGAKDSLSAIAEVLRYGDLDQVEADYKAFVAQQAASKTYTETEDGVLKTLL